MLLLLKYARRKLLSRRGLCLLLIVLSISHFSQASWIHVKATLAQQLLEGAWQQTLNQQRPTKAWPWADTWPVARLQMTDKNIDWLVLAGAHGEALAFGPGHLSGSAKPGDNGSTVIAGHNDTHFAFLQGLSLGEQLQLIDANGDKQSFSVTAIDIVDSKHRALWVDNQRQQLILVTCYPFNAVSRGGSLRYVVTAQPTIDVTVTVLAASTGATVDQSFVSLPVSTPAFSAVRYQL